MMDEETRTKDKIVPSKPSLHPDPRMSLTLDDIRPIFKNDPKVVYPLITEAISRRDNKDSDKGN